jgi:16S rRNA (uracil1498-N3)-methyltransferase
MGEAGRLRFSGKAGKRNGRRFSEAGIRETKRPPPKGLGRLGFSSGIEEMKIRRFKISERSLQGGEAVLDDPAELRHLTRALRLKPGDPVILFDGQGKEYPATIKRLTGRRAAFVLSPEPSWEVPEPSVRIILGIGLLKSAKLEWLIQKATELGVGEILPFHSLRVVPRPEEAAARNRLGRWEKIAAEAAKQCRRSRIPRIHPPRPFAEALAAFPEAGRIFLWEKERDRTLNGGLVSPFPAVYALVGPEGGFSADEARQAEAAGFSPVGLGPRILRAETAGLVIVALLQFLCGDLRG